jgi:hypothetical protein
LGATEFILRLFHIFGDVGKPAVLYAEPGSRIAMNEQSKRWWYSDVINKEIVSMITDAGVPSVDIKDKILPHAIINMNNIDDLDETTKFTIRLDGPFDIFTLEQLERAGINWDTKKLPAFTTEVEALYLKNKPEGMTSYDWMKHRDANKIPYSLIIHYGRKAPMLEFAVKGTYRGAEEVILWENTYNRNIMLESIIDLFSNRTYGKAEEKKLSVYPSNDRVAMSIIKRINVIYNREYNLWLMPTSYIETDTEYRGGSKRKYTKKKVVKGLPTKTITEAKLVKIRNAKEERDKNLYNRLAKVEPEEETLEQKIARQKKELRENRVR